MCSERCQKDLSSRRQELTAFARDAAVEGKRSLASQAHHYGSGTSLHWRRHKSLIDNDGEWKDSDIPKDVTAPVMRSLDRHWIVNFNAILDVASELQSQICTSVEGFVNDFAARLSAWPELQEHAASIGAAMVGGVSSMLEEEVEDFDTFIQEKRKGYAEDVRAPLDWCSKAIPSTTIGFTRRERGWTATKKRRRAKACVTATTRTNLTQVTT